MNLARASKFCKRLADPFLYRSIGLSDKDPKFEQTEQFFWRLLDPNDDLKRHVKDLRITGYGTSQGDRFDILVLEQVLDNIVEIKSFRYVFAFLEIHSALLSCAVQDLTSWGYLSLGTSTNFSVGTPRQLYQKR